MTRCGPRTSRQRRARAPSRSTTSSASRRCSVETYSSSSWRISCSASSSTRQKAVETRGCWAAPCVRGLPASAASALLAQVGDRSRRRARRACAAAPGRGARASGARGRSRGCRAARELLRGGDGFLDLIVSFWKSMCLSRVVWSVELASRARGRGGTACARAAPPRAVCRSSRVHARRGARHLVLEAKHRLDAGEVQAELGREPLDQAQPLEVGLGVEAGVAGRALRPHEALRVS